MATEEKGHIAKHDSLEGEKFEHEVHHGHDERDIVEGSEGVTFHELKTLRHVSDKLPWTAWLVVFVEFAER